MSLVRTSRTVKHIFCGPFHKLHVGVKVCCLTRTRSRNGKLEEKKMSQSPLFKQKQLLASLAFRQFQGLL